MRKSMAQKNDVGKIWDAKFDGARVDAAKIVSIKIVNAIIGGNLDYLIAQNLATK